MEKIELTGAVRPRIRHSDRVRHDGGMAKKRFRDLPPAVRKLVIALGVVQVSLNLAAQVDISRRSRDEIRGSKLRWRLISLINIAGPLTYFRRGRRPRA
jgi:hypothetical protein